jgi:hypothetical protein
MLKIELVPVREEELLDELDPLVAVELLEDESASSSEINELDELVELLFS